MFWLPNPNRYCPICQHVLRPHPLIYRATVSIGMFEANRQLYGYQKHAPRRNMGATACTTNTRTPFNDNNDAFRDHVKFLDDGSHLTKLWTHRHTWRKSSNARAINTGVAWAILPTSSSACMMRLTRAARTGRRPPLLLFNPDIQTRFWVK